MADVFYIDFTTFTCIPGKLQALAYRLPSKLISIDWTCKEGTNESSFWDVNTLESAKELLATDVDDEKQQFTDEACSDDDIEALASQLSSTSRRRRRSRAKRVDPKVMLDS